MSDQTQRMQPSGSQSQGPDHGEGKMPAEAQAGERTRERLVFRPRVDIQETGKGLVLTADLPGVSPETLDIELEKRVLTIRGRVDQETPEGYGVLYQEYEIGDFERRFTLSGDFDADKVEADLSNGVLTLTIPKAREPEARRIDVRAK